MRLRPAPHCRTPILSYSLRVSPTENFLNWQQDPFGNYQARLVFPKPAEELAVDVDLVAEMVAINPFDFFLEKEAETYPFSLRGDAGPRAEPVSGAGGGRAAAGRSGRRDAPPVRQAGDANDRPAGRHQPRDLAAPAVRLADGAGRVRARRDADARPWFVPRLRVAGGAGPAAARVRGALRLGLLDPAAARRDPDRRAGRRVAGRRRPARLDRGVPARRGLDRLRRDQRPHGGRGSHSAGLHGCPVDGGAHHRLLQLVRASRPGPRRRGVHLRDEGAAAGRRAAGHEALSRGSVAGHRSTGREGRRRPGPIRRPPDDGRRADVRVDRRPRRGRVEHRRDGPQQARPGRQAAAAAAGPVRARRPAAPRAGQVVPGRAAAAVGVLVLLPPRRPADLERSGAVLRGEAGARRRRGRRAAVHGGADDAPGDRVRAGAARLRGHLLLPLARAAAAHQRRRAEELPRRPDRASASGARVRDGAGDAGRARAAAARARRRR